MNTRYRVTHQGQTVGIFGDLADVKAAVAAHPGAEVKVVVRVSNPCTAHAAYEADNCPVCGTARNI